MTNIVLGICLLLSWMIVGFLVWCLLRANRTSTKPSPTPSTTPTPISDDSLTTILTTMRQMAEDSARETRTMVVDLVQGRPIPPPTGQTEIDWTSNEAQPNYDDDSIPLSPAIEAVFQREVNEDEQLRLLREQRALRDELAVKTEEWNRLNGSSSTAEPSLPEN